MFLYYCKKRSLSSFESCKHFDERVWCLKLKTEKEKPYLTMTFLVVLYIRLVSRFYVNLQMHIGLRISCRNK